MLVQQNTATINWSGSGCDYAGESRERYSILGEAFYLLNCRASAQYPKSGTRHEISIKMPKVMERKKQTTSFVPQPSLHRS